MLNIESCVFGVYSKEIQYNSFLTNEYKNGLMQVRDCFYVLEEVFKEFGLPRLSMFYVKEMLENKDIACEYYAIFENFVYSRRSEKHKKLIESISSNKYHFLNDNLLFLANKTFFYNYTNRQNKQLWKAKESLDNYLISCTEAQPVLTLVDIYEELKRTIRERDEEEFYSYALYDVSDGLLQGVLCV